MTVRDRLLALELFGIKLGLDNIRVLLDALGHPERAYPTLHVAGTNGKGSVSAMVERALRAAGHTTGLYTSPHLDRLEERTAVNGQPVDAAVFDAVTSEILNLVERLRSTGALSAAPTFFEVTTAIAFEVFRRAGAGVAVIEVGLGGRFDATNVITPLASAVTTIAFDHERHLGRTLAEIAREKAGVAKSGVPLVIGRLPEEARHVVVNAAAEAGAPLIEAARVTVDDVRMERGTAIARFETSRATYGPLRLALAGRHQVENAAVAVSLLEAAGARDLALDHASIETGLTSARWPARLEWLRTDDGDLLVDAAHNPAGAAALASYLQEAGVAPLPLVLAVMRDKDVTRMVGALRSAASVVVTTEVAAARSYDAAGLADEVRRIAPETQVIVESDPRRAVARALQIRGTAVAAGSIYFVGPLRARLLESGARSI